MNDINWTIQCIGCGECCGNVPFPTEHWERIRHKALRIYEPESFLDDTILPVTEDLVCVFLTDDKRCLVYNERPEICRLYGTIPELQCSYVNSIRPDFISLGQCLNFYNKNPNLLRKI